MRAVALTIAVFAATAFADNTADEADVAFSMGNAAVARGDYKHALAEYFRSYRLVPNRNVLFNLARCYEALGQNEEAYRYWHDVSVDPALPAKDKPEVKESLRRLASKVALLSITTEPAGADVFIDREDLGSLGRTPLVLALPVGAHVVTLSLVGYRKQSVDVKLALGKELKKPVTLEPITGRVKLEGTPLGATVRDSVTHLSLGQLPVELTLPVGKHILDVEAEWCVPGQALVEVREGQLVTEQVRLIEKPRPSGKVIITGNYDEALVRINGKESGYTPVVLDLPEGDYALSVSAPDFAPYTQQLHVTAGAEQRVAPELYYAPAKIKAASKTELSLDEAPASVTIITRDELLAFGYLTLPEALAAVRGLFFTNDRIYTYAGFRGFAPPGDLNTRVLILYDGHSFNDVWAGQGYVARDFDVDLLEVERIEVVRGPNSLVYGTGAFFGVINVVSRSTLGGRTLEGTFGAGDQGAVHFHAAGRAASDTLSVQASAAGHFAQGAPTTEFPGVGSTIGLDDERVFGGTVKAKWGDFTLAGKFNQRRKQLPTQILFTTPTLPGSWYTDTRGFAELKYEHTFGIATLGGKLTFDASRFEGINPELDADGVRQDPVDLAHSEWLGAEVHASFALGGSNVLTAGFDGQLQFINSQTGDVKQLPVRRFFVAGTLLDEWRITPWLFIHAGVRVDKYGDIAEWALSPRGAIVLKPYEQGVLKLIAARAFRAPNAYELFFGDDHATQIPAPTLKPELITNFELEHTHYFLKDLRLTVSGHVNVVDHLVSIYFDEPAGLNCGTTMPIACYQFRNGVQPNIGVGGDVSLRWQPARYSLLEAQYSYTHVFGADDVTRAAYPQHLLAVRGMVPLVDRLLRLSAQVVAMSTRENPDDGRAYGESANVSVGVSGDVGRFRYFGGARNLFDVRPFVANSSPDAAYVKDYGRSFWVELAVAY